jgi:hypothetical protein
MMARRIVALLVGAGAVLAIPSAARAQDPPQPPPRTTETDLVFEREIFRYPSFTRRNPFLALAATDAGPRYEQLSLIGIMYDDRNANASVAVLSTGGVSVADDGTTTAVEGDAYYLKVGEQIGNVTVVAIHRDRVVVDVDEFDARERQTMIFVSRRQGGSQ